LEYAALTMRRTPSALYGVALASVLSACHSRAVDGDIDGDGDAGGDVDVDAGVPDECDPAVPLVCSEAGDAVLACNPDGTLGELVESCVNGPCEAGACVDVPSWPAFLAAREGYLRDLAVPILACVARMDTSEPAFHGCIDWHSAVHGTWALLAIARLTGDTAYANAAEAVLDPVLVAAELDRLATTGISYEIPYGYAWFLRLARERAAAGKADLAPLADQVADDLEYFVFSRTADEVQDEILATDYDNLSWPVVNLWQHAVSVGDDLRADMMRDYARDTLLPADAACPLARERTQTDSFFPACLHRALALTAILPPDEARAWLDRYLPPPPFALVPLTMPSTAHSAGLDFSRAWGLFAIWDTTKDLAWLHLYLDHVETWMARPQYWAQDYDSYAHWVAQFGVYAIDLSFGE